MKTNDHSEHNYDPLFKSLRIEIRFKVWVPKEGKETKFGIIGHDIFLIILGHSYFVPLHHKATFEDFLLLASFQKFLMLNITCLGVIIDKIIHNLIYKTSICWFFLLRLHFESKTKQGAA